MSCACQISGMGKKKHKVGKAGGDDLLETLLLGATPGVGIIVAHEVKDYVMPMVYSDTDTADQKVMKNRIANAVGVIAGVGMPMLFSDPMAKKYATSFGGGFAGQCLYSLYLNEFKKNADGTPNNRVAGWDAKQWQAAKARAMAQKRINGNPDNASPGVFGNPDNASPGLMGVQKYLKLPNYSGSDVIGVGLYRKRGTGSF